MAPSDQQGIERLLTSKWRSAGRRERLKRVLSLQVPPISHHCREQSDLEGAGKSGGWPASRRATDRYTKGRQ